MLRPVDDDLRCRDTDPGQRVTQNLEHFLARSFVVDVEILVGAAYPASGSGHFAGLTQSALQRVFYLVSIYLQAGRGIDESVHHSPHSTGLPPRGGGGGRILDRALDR